MYSSLTISQLRRLKQAVALILAGTFLGPLYIVFSDGFVSIDPYINGLIGGFLVGLMVAVLELYVFGKSFRKLKFSIILFLRTGLYVLLIFVILLNVLIIYRMQRYDLSYSGVLNSEEFQDYVLQKDFPIGMLYAVVLALAINFTRMMSRKIGREVLLSFITGAYYKPVIEERIIMFLHIDHSSEISEKLGLIKFYGFLNDLLFDITESIIIHGGSIYQYVEDEVVISWSLKKGLENANAVRTFFHLQNELHALKEKYYQRYGLLPRLQAALHAGRLVRAEMGDVKSEIVFHGDVMNTTSRILHQCDQSDQEILISSRLKEMITLPQIYSIASCGCIKLKGKEKEMELFAIQESYPESIGAKSL